VQLSTATEVLMVRISDQARIQKMGDGNLSEISARRAHHRAGHAQIRWHIHGSDDPDRWVAGSGDEVMHATIVCL
jgi:hypothetical protein